MGHAAILHDAPAEIDLRAIVDRAARLLLDLALTGPTIELMKTIKKAMDPNGILNPGKVFEAPLAAHEVGFINASEPCC